MERSNYKSLVVFSSLLKNFEKNENILDDIGTERDWNIALISEIIVYAHRHNKIIKNLRNIKNITFINTTDEKNKSTKDKIETLFAERERIILDDILFIVIKEQRMTIDNLILFLIELSFPKEFIPRVKSFFVEDQETTDGLMFFLLFQVGIIQQVAKLIESTY